MYDASSNTITNYGSHDGISTPLTASSNTYGGTTPRLYGRQILSGNIRGNQNITGAITITDPDTNQQNISIDGSAQAITVTNTDGSVVGMGKLPDGTGFGFYATDVNGNMLYKIVGSTIYTYDLSQTPAVNNMQIMKLPDGSYGMAVAKTGFNISDAITK